MEEDFENESSVNIPRILTDVSLRVVSQSQDIMKLKSESSPAAVEAVSRRMHQIKKTAVYSTYKGKLLHIRPNCSPLN